MRFTSFTTALLVASLTASVTSAGVSHRAHPYRHRRHHARSVAAAAVSAAEALNNPSASESEPSSDFAANADLPAKELAAAALKLKNAAAKYQIDPGSSTWSTIYTDWDTNKNGSAIVFTSNMDIDCDGIDYKCKGNSDGQAQTDYGALAAYEVPWIVIPESYVEKSLKALPGNNVAAVICDGKMYYGIFGDSNGASTEVIGEASWRMGQACFPNDNISGENGHGASDVTYIVFTGSDAVLPKSAMTTNYITQFTTLKSMGDGMVSALVKNLGLSDSSSSGSESSTKTSSSKSSSKTETTKNTEASSTKKATPTAASDLEGDGEDDDC